MLYAVGCMLYGIDLRIILGGTKQAYFKCRSLPDDCSISGEQGVCSRDLSAWIKAIKEKKEKARLRDGGGIRGIFVSGREGLAAADSIDQNGAAGGPQPVNSGGITDAGCSATGNRGGQAASGNRSTLSGNQVGHGMAARPPHQSHAPGPRATPSSSSAAAAVSGAAARPGSSAGTYRQENAMGRGATPTAPVRSGGRCTTCGGKGGPKEKLMLCAGCRCQAYCSSRCQVNTKPSNAEFQHQSLHKWC